MRTPNVVIFDLGGVIINIDFLTENRRFLAKCGVGERGLTDFFAGKIWQGYENGSVSTERFAAEAVMALGYLGSAEVFKRDFCEMLGAELNAEVFGIIRSLKSLYAGEMELWMLSNINELHYGYLRSGWPDVFEAFSKVFLSFKLGERKPDEAIYRKVLREGWAFPEQCLFFDDLEENVLGARKAGLRARVFGGAAGLRKDLREAGFTIP